MYLQINTNDNDAQLLGYLLHKHPDNYQTKALNFGTAHMFYTDNTATYCTFNLVLEINSVALSRNAHKNNFKASFKLADYVNDRPYVASSFLTTAISKVLRSTMNGICNEKPELVQKQWPLTITINAVKSKKGVSEIHRFFEPLGYQVETETQLLDPQFEAWGMSPYFKLTLRGNKTLNEVLTHLYVLLPVLDNNKHYFVNQDEVNKLLDKGGDWLKDHPAKTIITNKYLQHRKSYTRLAFEQLMQKNNDPENETKQEAETAIEQKIPIHDVRLNTVAETLKNLNISTVADLGCGDGKLIRRLMKHAQFTKIIGMDASFQSIEMAKRRLKLEQLPVRLQEKLTLIQGALTYRDARIEGVDAVALVEVIEHLDEHRLEALEQVIFECIQPKYAVLTTPNSEYNQLFESLPNGVFRHSDHRFEWTREEFEAWGNAIAKQFNYTAKYQQLGEVHETYGGLSQMVVFEKQIN